VVTRGPYLQLGTPSSVVVRWRTDLATDSRVRYGTDIGNLAFTADDAAVTTEHVVAVNGLVADTVYYYSIGTATTTLAGGDSSYFFLTFPPSGTAKPTRVWVLGDSGTANANARAVRDAYGFFTGATHTDLWLMLGDNAYNTGTDAEYQNAVFNTYPLMLRKSVLWPTLGNHDGVTADSATQTGPYYAIFTLPRQGEAGGVASGTEAYYSFDYGNIHFICLESFETNRSAGGAMMTWLQADVLATSQDWIIAFWHHPPYSKGSHNSDTEVELIQMRENALPILEAGGVDLVLTGHSHSYERSYFLDGHYDTSDTLVDSMKVDGGDGRIAGDGAYRKMSISPEAHAGAVYTVAGSSGLTSGGALNHPAMFVSLNVLGSVVLDIDGPRLDALFLDSTGVVRDTFTIFKGPGAAPVADFQGSPTSGPVPLSVAFTDLSANGPEAWAWDFEDDGFVDSALRNPVHVYAQVGLYPVALTAFNAPGSDSEVKPGYICATSADGLGDLDGDAVVDGGDNCPCAANSGQDDFDGDLLGDACDPDDDGDGSPDAADCAPLDAGASQPPGDVGDTLDLGPAGTISWVRAPYSTASNVYRGAFAGGGPFAYNHACFEAASPDEASVDLQPPALGGLLYYLASGRNVCGEGSLGVNTAQVARPNLSPCP
jgi:PKD repeat protein